MLLPGPICVTEAQSSRFSCVFLMGLAVTSHSESLEAARKGPFTSLFLVFFFSECVCSRCKLPIRSEFAICSLHNEVTEGNPERNDRRQHGSDGQRRQLCFDTTSPSASLLLPEVPRFHFKVTSVAFDHLSATKQTGQTSVLGS